MPCWAPTKKTIQDVSVSIIHKTFASITHVVALMLIPQFAIAADANACYNIAAADARTYCLARVHRQPGQCNSIQNSAMRSMFLAEVRK